MQTRKRTIGIIIFSFVFLIINQLQAQVPEGVLFQAIAKDPSGGTAKGRKIHIKDAILKTTPTGEVVYSEKFLVETSDDGIFTIIIGKGQRLSGSTSFSGIEWSKGPYFLNIKVAVEPSIPSSEWNADNQYVDMGTSQFWTVPFAFMAANVEGLDLRLKTVDTTAMLQPYLRKTDTISISRRINEKLSVSDTSSLLSGYAKSGETLRFSDTTRLFNMFSQSAEILKLSDTSKLFLGLAKLGQTVQYTDTASMLSGYTRSHEALKISDTTHLFSVFAKTGESLKLSDTATLFSGLAKLGQTVQYTDTASLLSGYARSNEALKLSDTTHLFSVFAKTGESLKLADTATLFSGLAKLGQTVQYADTVSMLSGYARNNEALKLSDTTHLFSVFAKTGESLKLSDTATLFSGLAKLGQTVQYVDTASMLNHLLRVSDTANMLLSYGKTNEVVKFSDTSAMLQSLLRITDTTSMLAKYAKSDDVLKFSDTAGVFAGFTRSESGMKYTDTAGMLAPYSKLKTMGAVSLLGNPTGNANAATEITLGTGLSFSGSRLDVSAAAVAETFTSDIVVYSINGFGKYSQGQTIPAIGKTTKQVLMDALTQEIPPVYTQPTVTISGSPSPGNFEIGSNLNITLSSNFTQNDAGTQTSVSYSKGGSALGSNTDNIASLTSAVSYTSTVFFGQGSVKNNNLGTPDPTGQIAAGSKTSSAITYTPQAKRYWGYASTNTPSDANILAVAGGGAELSGSRAKGSFSITISGGSPYIFYAYPASLGLLTSISVGGFESLGTFTRTTRSVTNAQGYTQNYNIYVSTNSVGASVNNIIIN